MKQILYIILTIFTSNVSYASSENADKLYHAMQYDSALTEYQTSLKSNEYSAVIFYNMGNCYWKTGDTLRAYLYYMKSLRLNPSDEDCRQNLKVVQKFLPIDNQNMQAGLSGWFDSWTRMFSINFWSWLCILLINLGFLLLIARKFLLFLRARIYQLFAIALLLSGIAIYITAAVHYYHFINDRHGMIVEEFCPLKAEPSENSSEIKVIPGGTILSVEKENDNWYYIKLDKNTFGWLEKKYLEKI